MDLMIGMSPEILEDKLEHATDGKSPEATWNTRRLPTRLEPGWANRLFVAAGGFWRGYFPLSGEVLWNPDDETAAYALIFDTRGWTPIVPLVATRFRGWRYGAPVDWVAARCERVVSRGEGRTTEEGDAARRQHEVASAAENKAPRATLGDPGVGS